METLPLRLHPGDDLRRALEDAVASRGLAAAFVLAGIGSLRPTVLRLAGADEALTLAGDVEILGVCGTIGNSGGNRSGSSSHLHLSVADAQGRVLGGHAGYGCRVRTTAELLLALLPGWQFRREPDAATGYAELVVERLAAAAPAEGSPGSGPAPWAPPAS